MDDGTEPQRIEIELTSHDSPHDRPHGHPHGRFSRRSTDAPGDAESGDRSVGLLATERGRLISVGAFAAVTALLVGVLVGRLGASDVETADEAASTTSVPTTTSVTGDDEDTLPSAPEVLAGPTTTRPTATTRPTSAGGGGPEDPERVVKGTIDIDPAIPADAIEVTVLTNSGDVVRIDVPTGTTVTTSIDGAQYGPPAIHSGDGWVLVPSFDELRGSTVIHDDGSRSSLDTGIAWPLMANAASGTFWVSDDETGNRAPSRFVEIEIDGSQTGAAVELDGFYPQMIDPRGGLVVQAPGGLYAMSSESTVRITSGRLLALGLDRAVVHECGATLECGYFLLDRTTGNRTDIELDGELSAEGVTIDAGGWWSFSEPLNPAGNAMLVSVWMPALGGRQSMGVVDLESGTYQEIGDFIETPSMAWTPDGRSVYWIDRGRLTVFDLATGASTLFAEDLGAVNAFTLRPTLPSVDATATTPSTATPSTATPSTATTVAPTLPSTPPAEADDTG